VEIYPRVAGRLGNQVRLNMQFLHNGISEEPFALRRIDIYRGFIRLGNIVGQIIFPEPTETGYPDPAIQDPHDPGSFEAIFEAPSDLVPCDVYFDVWNFIPENPGATADLDDENLWVAQTGRFWLFDDVWIGDDELRSLSIGFEPLDKQLCRGEIRTLEVAIHPLPKYSYDFNALAPIIPQLSPTITIETVNGELLSGLVNAPCKIGIRQGHHRNSPFVIQCQLDTRLLLRGTYRYVVQVQIEDKTIISDKFSFTLQ